MKAGWLHPPAPPVPFKCNAPQCTLNCRTSSLVSMPGGVVAARAKLTSRQAGTKTDEYFPHRRVVHDCSHFPWLEISVSIIRPQRFDWTRQNTVCVLPNFLVHIALIQVISQNITASHIRKTLASFLYLLARSSSFYRQTVWLSYSNTGPFVHGTLPSVGEFFNRACFISHRGHYFHFTYIWRLTRATAGVANNSFLHHRYDDACYPVVPSPQIPIISLIISLSVPCR